MRFHGFAASLGAAALLLTTGLASVAEAREMRCSQPQSRVQVLQVAGGEDANPTDWPFIVSVTSSAGSCGGSLFAKGFVLTAAHCVMPAPGRRGCRPAGPGRCELTDASDITVSRSDPSGRPTGESRRVTGLAAHPDFRHPVGATFAGAYDADIAILRLEQPFDLGRDDYVRLADRGVNASYAKGGECARVAGWGDTNVWSSDWRLIAQGKKTDKLQDLNLALVPDATCRGKYGEAITDNMLCAGDGITEANTCSGDSGGPLIVDIGVPMQVGVVSWAYGCAQVDHFTVFARVGSPSVAQWIDDVMSGRAQ